MIAFPHLPISVSLRWVPGSMHLVQFRAWDRTFIVALVHVHFDTPQAQSSLYLLGTVRVSMLDIQLSTAEQKRFDDLEAAEGRDDVLNEAWPRGGGTPPAAFVS
jgi:hypothetical protein